MKQVSLLAPQKVGKGTAENISRQTLQKTIRDSADVMCNGR